MNQRIRDYCIISSDDITLNVDISHKNKWCCIGLRPNLELLLSENQENCRQLNETYRSKQRLYGNKTLSEITTNVTVIVNMSSYVLF
jgi:hypothetical protein